LNVFEPFHPRDRRDVNRAADASDINVPSLNFDARSNEKNRQIDAILEREKLIRNPAREFGIQ